MTTDEQIKAVLEENDYLKSALVKAHGTLKQVAQTGLYLPNKQLTSTIKDIEEILK